MEKVKDWAKLVGEVQGSELTPKIPPRVDLSNWPVGVPTLQEIITNPKKYTRSGVITEPVQCGMITVLMEITPAYAAAWLRHNVLNRRLNTVRVGAFEGQIVRGTLHLTHQGIAFYRHPNGDLILLDGQHRLQAIVNTGKTVKMLVSFNIHANAAAAIDIGQGRSCEQGIKLNNDLDKKPVPTGLIPRANTLRLIIEGKTTSKAEVAQEDREKETVLRYTYLLNEILKFVPYSGTVLSRKSPAAAIGFMYPAHPQKIAQFARQVIKGEMIAEGDPAYTLIQFLKRLNDKTEVGGANGDGRDAEIRAVLVAAHAHVEGRKLLLSALTRALGDKNGKLVRAAWDYFGQQFPQYRKGSSTSSKTAVTIAGAMAVADQNLAAAEPTGGKPVKRNLSRSTRIRVHVQTDE